MAAARPAIMIPFPFAVDDHQTANAQYMVDTGAGQIIQQTDLNPLGLSQAILNGLDSQRLVKNSEYLAQVAKLNAAKTIVAHIMEWN
jgi:UDP-N-acetylglucosamine--N-acetylmuramyl-(pentapeptide) pyrophosphoryl-undecaprenol N-acetylglucosamine transferase